MWYFYLVFVSGILSGIKFNNLSGILSGILIWHSCLPFFSGVLSGILSDIFIWHSSLIFYLIFYLAFLSGILIWHFSLVFYLVFYLAYFLAFSPAIEVRQGTLGMDSRGWGPVGNIGRGFSRLRSGREHLVWILTVEVRQGTLGVDGRGWGPEEAELEGGNQLI